LKEILNKRLNLQTNRKSYDGVLIENY